VTYVARYRLTVSYPRTTEGFVNTSSHIDHHLVEVVCEDLVVEGHRLCWPVVGVAVVAAAKRDVSSPMFAAAVS